MPENAPARYAKIQAATAGEVAVRVIGEAEDSTPAPDTNEPPISYFERLIAEGRLPAAVRFLAAALPAREAVWWACTCVRDVLSPEAPPVVAEALKAAGAWVYHPDEQHRRAAEASVAASGLSSPASWAAQAAFWSGGSIAPAGEPEVAPAATLLPAAVAGAVLLAAVETEPERAEEHYRAFLTAGLDIADGGNGRPAPAAEA